MAFELHRHAFPGIAATHVAARQVVKLAPGAIERGVMPAAAADEPIGVALTTATAGNAVTVHEQQSVAKVVAAASLGAAANVGVVGATTSLGPVASGSMRTGQSVAAAQPGEVFSLYVNPRQL